MIPAQLIPLANHLWQSTLFAGMMLLLTLALRKNRARVRYWLWLAASLKFLIPFSLLVGIGSQLGWRTVPAVPPVLSSAIEKISQPFAPRLTPAMPAPSAPAVSTITPALLIVVWFGGCAVVVSLWWLRWRRIRTALRTASPLTLQAPIRVLSSPTLLEPGVFGVFRPVLLLPEGISDRLTSAQFRSILAHEFCHVRRRDNLILAIHMVVEAAFWFHPLAWWIGARLMEERERACDEEVLRQGSDPGVYASGILNVCKFYLESPLPCASGVTGSNLKKRVEAILTNRIVPGLTPARKLILAAAGIVAVAGPILIGILNVPRAQAQASGLRFEVASIKPTKATGGRGGMQVLPGGGLRMEGVTLKQLIAIAYRVRESQISGGPAWMGSETYELLAKPERSEAADNPQTTAAPGNTAWNRLEQRTQALLAERFQLAIHKNVKEEAGYVLAPAKGGAKLEQSPEGDNRPAGTNRSPGRIDGRNGTMLMLATVLSNFLGRPVVDRTGLHGTYTYKLEYSQDSGPEANPVDLSGPSIFTALQEQLGLKLESQRVPVEFVVIDRAEKPSAN
jgi:uncharacterized protein (TIGR03435 family)